MHYVEIIIALFLIPVAFDIWGWVKYRRALKNVYQWAHSTQVELVSVRYRDLWTGPFAFDNARGQFVFRVSARDRTGKVHAGWLRVGDRLIGVLSKKTEIIWDS